MYVKSNVMTVKGTLVSPTMCKFTYIMYNLVMVVILYSTAFVMVRYAGAVMYKNGRHARVTDIVEVGNV